MTVPVRLGPSPETLRLLLEPREGPCVSLTFPACRASTGYGEGVVLRHLVERAAALLEDRVGRERCESLLAPWRALADDAQGWRGVDCDGFAGFAAEGHGLPRPLGPKLDGVHGGSLDPEVLLRRVTPSPTVKGPEPVDGTRVVHPCRYERPPDVMAFAASESQGACGAGWS